MGGMTSFSRFLVVSSLLAVGCSYLGGRSALVDHKGPNQVFTVKTPTDAEFTKIRDTKKTVNGDIAVNEEKWTAPNEGGFAGVLDLPARASAAIGSKQMLEQLPKLITEGMGGRVTSTKFVNKLGFEGVENEFDIPNKSARGRSVFWRAGRSVYFCQYYALNSIWDSGRADAIMGSFRYSTLKKH